MSYNWLFKSCILVLFLSGTVNHAFIRYLAVWENAKGCIVYGCGDDHRVHPSNYLHIAFLKSLALADHKNYPLYIVEDYKGYHGDNPEIARFIESTAAATSLAGLYDFFISCLYKVTNAEYRFSRFASLCPILDYEEALAASQADCQSDQATSENFPTPEYSIPASTVIKEFDNAVAGISHHDNSDCLRNYYQNLISSIVEKSPSAISTLRDYPKTMGQFMYTQIEPSQRLNLANHLYHFDAELLDAGVLKQIVQESTCKRIYLFLGYQHVFNIGKILEQELGFKKKYEAGNLPLSRPLDPVRPQSPLTPNQLEILRANTPRL